MDNIVPCKVCGKDINYIPGPAGNARQMCTECRIAADDAEVLAFEEEMIKEKNKYLVGAPGRKNVYDPSEIILEGIIPEFKSAADMFVCAVEVGQFVGSNGCSGKEDNVVKFLWALDSPQRIIFLKQQPMDNMNHMAKHPSFKELLKWAMRVAV